MKDKAQRSVGRVVVLSAYWLLLVYAFGTIFGSMLHTLYSEPPSAQDTSESHHRWCVSQLAGLKSELENRVLDEVDASQPASAWRADWEARLATARQRCGNTGDGELGKAYEALARLHEAYTSGLQTFAVARRDTSAPLDAQIKALAHQ